MKKFEPDLKTLIEIGKDAKRGKICDHCGRTLRKATGKLRVCSKCADAFGGQ